MNKLHIKRKKKKNTSYAFLIVYKIIQSLQRILNLFDFLTKTCLYLMLPFVTSNIF